MGAPSLKVLKKVYGGMSGVTLFVDEIGVTAVSVVAVEVKRGREGVSAHLVVWRPSTGRMRFGDGSPRRSRMRH